MNKWRDSKSAPVDGNPFLGLVDGYPFPVLCAWSGAEKKFVHTMLQVNTYHGKANDVYFENDYCGKKGLRGWMPLPDFCV